MLLQNKIELDFQILAFIFLNMLLFASTSLSHTDG